MAQISDERRRMIALYGPLVVRLVDRVMNFRFERLKYRLKNPDAIGSDDGTPEHLSRYAEATAMVAIVQAAKLLDLPRDYSPDRADDAGSYFRLYGLEAGHVMTEHDIRDLEAVLAELNDEIGNQADKAHEWRIEAFREIGGEELVRAVENKDKLTIDTAVERAMAKFRAASKAPDHQSDSSSAAEAARP